MKRLTMTLALVGLMFIFTAAAWAVDAKISGEFYAAGMYLDRTTLKKDIGTEGPSTAFYAQRLRINATFIISPGLSLVTRADILERMWGATRSAAGADPTSAGTRAENENIAFDWAYVHYNSPIGAFRVGYMNDNVFGTVFADGATPKGKIAWSYVQGPWFVTAQIVKMGEKSYSAVSPATTASDVDNDKYCAAVRYTWKGGEVGFLGGVGHDASNRSSGNYSALFYTVIPYAVVQLGRVKIQAEADYFWGKWQDFDTTTPAVHMSALAAWLDATADFGRFYVGGSVAYVSGDDPGTSDKIEANSLLVNGGRDWNPCLILFNYDTSFWAGQQVGHNPSASLSPTPAAPNPYGYNGGPMTNAWFFQLRAGARPIDKLDIMASVSFANADKKPRADWLYNDYGYEIDVTATYKITNNLSYLLGAGYLFTGKYFKGVSEAQNVHDNYLLIHKLTLTF
jgi:hypothetical protein